MTLNKSKIDYLDQSEAAIGRPGYTLNIVTGCKHSCEYCYARRMVEHGRLKGHPSYPYGFEPTLHPERIQKIGGKPKLIFLNDMGDVGGGWEWDNYGIVGLKTSSDRMAYLMRCFALLNRQHIIILLTKNPSWYRYAEWPDNVWCGFSATNNEELYQRWDIMTSIVTPPVMNLPRIWASLEPWMDDEYPDLDGPELWLAIGGLSGPGAKPVSEATLIWLLDSSIQAKRFMKSNAGRLPDGDNRVLIGQYPREYPDEWKVTDAQD